MVRAKAGTGSLRKTQRPVVTLPEMDKATAKKIRETVDAQWREATGRPQPVHKPFRFRFQLVPLCWAAAAMAGLAGHAVHARAWLAVIGAAVTVLATVAGTRHKDQFFRRYNQGMAAWAGCWAAALCVTGLGPWAAAWLIGWAVPSAQWVHHYRWRGPKPQAARPDRTAEEIFARLAERKKWHASLGLPQAIPNGKQYLIECVGALTNIGEIVKCPREIAAAYDAPVTEAYAEPDPSGIESKGLLTLLRTSPLDAPRRWAGGSIDPATGLAVAGRFPDGQDVHEQFFVPGYGGGAVHSIISGCPGSGKTGKLDLGMCISATSGVVSTVILDPQEGQSMPDWQDHVPYACGAGQCIAYLRAFHAAMLARSAQMSRMRWCRTHVALEGNCPEDGRTCRIRKGMGWFDPYVTGLPIVEIIIDEAPVLLAYKGMAELLLDLLKLGRKTGFRIVLATQVPSIAELGKGELRAMLVGDNVFGLRAGDKVSSGMMNIEAKLNEIPKFFRNKSKTRGLGYASTVEMRPGVLMRLDWVEDPSEVAERADYRELDGTVAEVVASVLAQEDARAEDLARAADDAADVQSKVLAALTGPTEIGELIKNCPGLQVSEVVSAVEDMVKAGKVTRNGNTLEKA